MSLSHIIILILSTLFATFQSSSCVKWRYTTIRVFEKEENSVGRLWLRGGTMDKGEPIPIKEHRGVQHTGNTGPPDPFFAQWAEGDTMLDLDGAEETQGDGAEGTPMMRRLSGLPGIVEWEAHFQMDCDQLLPDYPYAYNKFLAKAVRVEYDVQWELGQPHVVECGKINKWIFVEETPDN